MARAKALGIQLRSGGTRTRPLDEADMYQLGLRPVRDAAQSQAGRDVNFMIFESAEGATSRGASMFLDGGQ